MFLAVVHLTAIQMTARDIQMRCCLLWNWRLAGISTQHAPQPAQGFTKIPPRHRWQPEVMANQPDIVLIVSLFRRLQGPAKLALGGGPFAPRDLTKPARVTAFDSH